MNESDFNRDGNIETAGYQVSIITQEVVDEGAVMAYSDVFLGDRMGGRRCPSQL